MSSPDWYKPPAADIPAETLGVWAPGPYDTVGFWPRVMGRIVDAVVGAVLAYFSGLLASTLRQSGLPIPHATPSLWASLLLSTVVPVIYHSVAESIGGASPGKLVLGFRVRMEDGRPCTISGAVKRSILYIWDAFFFAAVAYSAMKGSPMNQRVGDRWAGTIVVRARAIPDDEGTGQRALLGALVMMAMGMVYAAIVRK